jgi:hypothetical protein
LRTKLISFALIAEAALFAWASYVLYRWSVANARPWNRFSDLIPYWGKFAIVVAPWLGLAVIIPAYFVVVAIVKRLRRD